MQTAMVRIDKDSHALLRLLSEQTHESMQALLRKAIEAYRRSQFFEAINCAYAESTFSPSALAADEQAVWDATLMDGLDPHEQWTESIAPPLSKKRGVK